MSDTNTATPAGWYPDPHGLPQQRWWNGHHWTVNVVPTPEPEVTPGPTPLSSLPGPRRSTAAAYAASSVGPEGLATSALAPNAFELAATATATSAFPTRRQLRELAEERARASEEKTDVPQPASTHSYAATHSYAPSVSPAAAPAYATAAAQGPSLHSPSFAPAPQGRPYAPAPFAEPEFAPRDFAPQFAPAEVAPQTAPAFPTTLAQAGPPVVTPPIAVTGTTVRGALAAAPTSSFAPPVAAPATNAPAASPSDATPAASEAPASIPGWHPAPSTTGDLALREPLRALGSPEATALAAAPARETQHSNLELRGQGLLDAPAVRTAPTQGHPGAVDAPRAARPTSSALASDIAPPTAPSSIPQHFPTPVSAAPAADSPQRLFAMPAAAPAASSTDSTTSNQAYQPFGMVSRTKAGVASKPTVVNTLSAWIIAITPLLMAGVAVAVVTWLSEFYTLFMQGGLVAIFAVATIAFAIRDQRELRSAGHVRTASPAWLLLTPLAYLISRTVEVKRQSGYAGSVLLVWLLAVAAVVAGAFLFPEWLERIAVATGHY